MAVPWESRKHMSRLGTEGDDLVASRVWAATGGSVFPLVFFLALGALPLLLVGAASIAVAGIDGLAAVYRWLRYNRTVDGRRRGGGVAERGAALT